MVAASSSPSDSHQIVLDTSVESTVVMASIVEKETAVAEERPLVASVYYNRLQKRIALDADPSIIYAELLAGSYTGALHHDDMQFNSPYKPTNLWDYPRTDSESGQERVGSGDASGAVRLLLFRRDAQGHHRFARTIEEHNKNVAAYRGLC